VREERRTKRRWIAPIPGSRGKAGWLKHTENNLIAVEELGPTRMFTNVTRPVPGQSTTDNWDAKSPIITRMEGLESAAPTPPKPVAVRTIRALLAVEALLAAVSAFANLHLMHYEKPAAVNTAVLEFIAGVEAG
jgi:hypothetical protein